MAAKTVEFRVTADNNLRYWLAVDDKDLPLVNGVGKVSLDGEHILYWWMVGNSGDGLGIVGMQGNKPAVMVKRSEIPSGSTKAGGFRRFTV